MEEQGTNQPTAALVPASISTPSRARCPTCGGSSPATPPPGQMQATLVGTMTAAFPSLSVEKKFAQLLGQKDFKGFTDRRIAVSEAGTFAGIGSITYTILNNTSLSKQLASIVAVTVFLLLCFLLIIYRLWNAKETSFRFLDSDHGEAADSPVKAAQHLIQTTHFTGIVPYQPYIALLNNKMAEGVKVKRIVARDAHESPTKYDWFDTFRGLPGYDQIDIHELFPLPLDIMIFDHHTVVLHLPSAFSGNDFHSALQIENEQIAHLFENMFCRMEIRGRQQGLPNNLVTVNHSIPC
jgi:hypothetical protein